MSTNDEKKLKRRSLGALVQRHSHSAGEASSQSEATTDSVRSTGSLGRLTRAVLERPKSQGSGTTSGATTTANSLDSQAIELSEQAQHNFSSSGGGGEKSKEKAKKDKTDKKRKLKRRHTASDESTAAATTTACTTAATVTPSPTSSSSPSPIVFSPLPLPAGEESVGQRPQRSQSYSEPHESTRSSLSPSQRASLETHAAFARDLRQISASMRENASQIAILRAEVEGLHKLELARQKMAIDDRIQEIDEEAACCGCKCCGGLFDCLF